MRIESQASSYTSLTANLNRSKVDAILIGLAVTICPPPKLDCAGALGNALGTESTWHNDIEIGYIVTLDWCIPALGIGQSLLSFLGHLDGPKLLLAYTGQLNTGDPIVFCVARST